MCSESIYTTSLATTYAESVAMVEDLAKTSLASVYTSLLPPIFSKQDIITCLQKHKKVCDRLDKKLACLTLLTDYVVAAIANPFLVDIFQQDTTYRSKKYMMDIVSIGWVSLFQAIQNSLSMNKPSKEAMQATLSFLRRMDHLLQPCDLRLSSLRLTSASDPCFWSCGLQAIDGGRLRSNLSQGLRRSLLVVFHMIQNYKTFSEQQTTTFRNLRNRERKSSPVIVVQ